jgi:glycine/D-amino acid oxidase-like deaminating enzyme
MLKNSITDQKIQAITVIGAGLMGSSAAWQLSNYGEDVLLIEQQDTNYSFGSSFGEARISRSLGPENDIFSYLQQRSVFETEKLIAFLNKHDDGQKHTMEDIYRTSPLTYIYYKSQQEEVDLLLNNQQDPFEFAEDTQTAAKLFSMNISDSAMVIREYKKYTGSLNPAVLIKKLHLGIKLCGNAVLYNQKVIHLKRKNGLYEIRLEHTKTSAIKTILSKQVISAAGPYNSALADEVAPHFNKLINPKRLFLTFLKITPDIYLNLSNEHKARLQSFFPVINMNPEFYYSMIEKFDEDGVPLLKVGGHLLRTEVEDLDQVWQKDTSPEEISWSKTMTSQYLSMLNLPIKSSDLQFVKGYSCVYSMTKSEVPYVSNIVNPNNEVDPNFVLVGGMSGIGAKGSLTYGLLAANLLLNKKESSAMYQKTKLALGTERLLNDLNTLQD